MFEIILNAGHGDLLPPSGAMAQSNRATAKNREDGIIPEKAYV